MLGFYTGVFTVHVLVETQNLCPFSPGLIFQTRFGACARKVHLALQLCLYN